MIRLTKQNDQGQYFVEPAAIISLTEGCSGEAIERLAQFENFYYDMISSQATLSKELEELRNEGKEKSVKFRELLGKKLMNNHVLIALKEYGLE